MNKYDIVQRIENFAPPETAEKWDCSGWLVETEDAPVNKIMLALTVTEDVYEQAKIANCDMIISHHPLFFIPIRYKDINIYCAHTNMDIANGGTTDSFIEELSKKGLLVQNITKPDGFVRYIDTNMTQEELLKVLSKFSSNLRFVNPYMKKHFSKLAICAGSGSEFINEAFKNGADAYITGDLKFHTALDSPIAVFDVGHFETEIQILKVFEKLINNKDIVFAKEKSPFTTYTKPI